MGEPAYCWALMMRHSSFGSNDEGDSMFASRQDHD
jgi:hypothetical protein